MPQSLDSQLISVAVAATVNNPLDLQNVASPLNLASSYGWSTGNGAGQADRLFSDTRTIAPSGTDSLDLAGVLIDPVGTTLALARVKLILIRAAAANTNNVIVGGVANGLAAGPILPQTTGQVVVRPGGLLLVTAPDVTAYVVTAATGDLLQVANSGAGTSVTYDVVLIGSSV